MPKASPLLLSAVLTLLVLPAGAAAQSGRSVEGPSGLTLVKPAAQLSCDTSVRAGIRFTAASRRAGVRSVTVSYGSRSVVVKAPRKTTWKRLAFAAKCDGRSTLRYKIVRRGRKAVTRKYTLTVAPQTPDPGTPQPGQPGQEEPGGPPQLDSAVAPDPGGNPSSWQTFASVRSSGSRAGYTCAQALVDNNGTRRGVIDSFCGHPDRDGFIVKSVTAPDPHTGAQRTIVSGVAGLDLVASVAVEGPDGTRTLPLSAAERLPGVGGEFIAVYDGSVPVSALTLVVTRKDGQVTRLPNPVRAGST